MVQDVDLVNFLTCPENISKLESQVTTEFSLFFTIIISIVTSAPPPPPPSHRLLGQSHKEDSKGDTEGSEDGEEGKLDRDALGALSVSVATSAGRNLEVHYCQSMSLEMVPQSVDQINSSRVTVLVFSKCSLLGWWWIL